MCFLVGGGLRWKKGGKRKRRSSRRIRKERGNIYEEPDTKKGIDE